MTTFVPLSIIMITFHSRIPQSNCKNTKMKFITEQDKDIILCLAVVFIIKYSTVPTFSETNF